LAITVIERMTALVLAHLAIKARLWFLKARIIPESGGVQALHDWASQLVV
jgi:hypothetical protein